ncbi:MAG: flagellar M-ring protein FliF [Opitutae bacterium]|jgi:flagellar M-ring protein FliF|nr:flagellar M-ring protein FliF [Opitutae bacterium]|tara:strand:+ start:154 stop:1719 length:1566 start_codon:yes stop_codon:yes gene_type:complete
MKERFDKFLEIWTRVSTGQKISLVVAVLGIIGLSVGIMSWTSGGTSMRPLVNGADSKDLSEVVELLKSNQVEYEISESGDSILVPEDKRAQMRMEMAMKGLPKSGDVGYEIFDEGNFGISDFVQRTNYTRAIQGELARTISAMDAVRSAKVFVVQPENNLLLSEDPNDRPSATVYVDTGGNTLDKSQVNAIQFLVARASKGVNKSFVTVVDNQGNTLSDEDDGGGVAGVAGQMMKAYEAQERRLETKIETMLSKIVEGGVVARVSVNLNTESLTSLDEKFDPEGQVPRTTTTDKDDATTVETQPQNTATGMGANVPNVSQDATQQDPIMAESKEKRESKTTDFEISRTVKESVQEPGSIIGRSAAVLIARGEQPRTEDDMTKIKESVVNAIGVRFDEKIGITEIPTYVTVHEVDFVSSAGGLAGETLNEFQNFMDTWGPHLKSLLGVVLAIAILIVFARMLKKFKASDAEVQVLDEVDADALAGARSLGGGLTPELLNDLIQEKPDNVGTALKRYLETGAS